MQIHAGGPVAWGLRRVAVFRGRCRVARCVGVGVVLLLLAVRDSRRSTTAFLFGFAFLGVGVGGEAGWWPLCKRRLSEAES